MRIPYNITIHAVMQPCQKITQFFENDFPTLQKQFFERIVVDAKILSTTRHRRRYVRVLLSQYRKKCTISTLLTNTWALLTNQRPNILQLFLIIVLVYFDIFMFILNITRNTYHNIVTINVFICCLIDVKNFS